MLHCYAAASRESLFLVATFILDSTLTQRCPSARVVAHCMSVQDKDKADKDFYRCRHPVFAPFCFCANTLPFASASPLPPYLPRQTPICTSYIHAYIHDVAQAYFLSITLGMHTHSCPDAAAGASWRTTTPASSSASTPSLRVRCSLALIHKPQTLNPKPQTPNPKAILSLHAFVSSKSSLAPSHTAVDVRKDVQPCTRALQRRGKAATIRPDAA